MTKRSAGHIPDDDIAAFLARRLSPQREEDVIAHLAECARCRTLITEFQRSQEFSSDPGESSR